MGSDLTYAVQIRSIVAVGELAGPPLGGIVYSSWGFDGILIISLGVLAVDLILRLVMKEKPMASGGETSWETEMPHSATERLRPLQPLPVQRLLNNQHANHCSP